MPQILLLLKSSKKWEGDREGWQISAGLYFDKAIASDSCDSDSEDEGRKNFGYSQTMHQLIMKILLSLPKINGAQLYSEW